MITYKDLLRFKPGRMAMTLLIAASSLTDLLADNRITVENFTIINGNTAVVSVKLENDDPTLNAMGATIELPAGMKIVQEYDQYVDQDLNFILNSSRTYDPEKLYDEQTRQRHFLMDNKTNDNKYIIGIGHDEGMPFLGNKGDEIFHFTVEATDALGDNTKLKFSDISFASNNDETLQEDFEVEVTKVASVPPTAIISTDFDATALSITPGADHYKIVTVSMNNDSDISGLSMKIALPTGLNFVTGVEGYPGGVSYFERSKKLQPKLNRTTGVLTMSTMNQNDKILAGSGPIFAFLVEATTDLAAESIINLADIRLTTKYQNTVYTIKGEDLEIEVFNPDAAAKPAADEAIENAEQAMTDAIAKAEEALKEVTDKYEDYMGSDNMKAAEEAAQAAIDALKDKIQDAWESGNLAETDYSPEVAACEATVAALEKAGKEEVAKAEADNAIAAAEAALEAAKKAVEENYPEVKDAKPVTDAIQDAQDKLDAFKNKVNEAYGKQNLQDATTDEWEGLTNAAIEKIVPTADLAKNYKDELDEEAKNTQTLADAKKTATDASNAVPTEVKNDVAEEQQALDDALKALEDAVNAAAANRNANTDDVKADIAEKAAAVEEAAEALTEAAQEAKEAYDAEVAAEKANEQALSDAIKAAKDAENAVPTNVKDAVAAEQQALTDAVKALEDAVIAAAQNKNAADPAVQEAIAEKAKAVEDAIEALADAADAAEAQQKVDEEAGKVDGLNVPEDVAASEDPEVQEAVKAAEDAIKDAQDAVDALQDLVDDAIANGTLDSEEVQEAIADAIEAVEDAIKAAEQAIKDAEDLKNAKDEEQKVQDEAYGDLMKDINDLKDAYQAAVDGFDELEDVDAEEYQEALDEIAKDIDDLQKKVQDAYDNGELNGDTRIDDIDPGKKQEILDAIQGVADEAAAEQAAEDLLDGLAHQGLADLQGQHDASVENANENEIPYEEYADEHEAADKALAELADFIDKNDGNFRDEEVADKLAELLEAADEAVDALNDKIDELIAAKKVIPGDINADGDVDASDLATLIFDLRNDVDNDLIPTKVDEERFTRFDANQDGKINVADAQAIFNIMFADEEEEPAASRDENVYGQLSATATKVGELTRIALSLNSNARFTGFQMDVVLSEGMRVANESMDQQVELTSADLRNGNHRIVAFNPESANIGEGKILYIDVLGEGTVDFANIHFTTAGANSYSFGFNGDATGISRLSTAAVGAEVYDLSGHRVEAAKKGVNIIRTAKGTAKVIK